MADWRNNSIRSEGNFVSGLVPNVWQHFGGGAGAYRKFYNILRVRRKLHDYSVIATEAHLMPEAKHQSYGHI